MARRVLAARRGRAYRFVMTETGERPALPTSADVDAAAQRLKGIALHTPLISSPVLDALTGDRAAGAAARLE